jgi:hypothetical protein
VARANPICYSCGTKLTSENWSPSFQRNYNYLCKRCNNKKVSKWASANRAQRRKIGREWKRDKYWKDPEAARLQEREAKRRLKLEVLTHYSGGDPVCSNPFEIHEKAFSIVEALSIDHTNGGGHAHARLIGGSLYKWLRKNHFPPGFQVLCMNCQWIKRARRDENAHNFRGREKL